MSVWEGLTPTYAAQPLEWEQAMTDGTSLYTIPARPTTYKGVEMRSRLEANFASLLDGWGIEWQYEPQCYANEQGQYLPDFETTGWYLPSSSLGVGGRMKTRWFFETKPVDIALSGVGVGNAIETRMDIILSSVPDAGLCLWFPEDWWMCVRFPQWPHWGMGRMLRCRSCDRKFIRDEFAPPAWCPHHPGQELANISALGEWHPDDEDH